MIRAKFDIQPIAKVSLQPSVFLNSHVPTQAVGYPALSSVELASSAEILNE
jgi:hypothetical protein